MKGSWWGMSQGLFEERPGVRPVHPSAASAERGAGEAPRWEGACFRGQEGLQLSEGWGGQTARPQSAGERLRLTQTVAHPEGLDLGTRALRPASCSETVFDQAEPPLDEGAWGSATLGHPSDFGAYVLQVPGRNTA